MSDAKRQRRIQFRKIISGGQTGADRAALEAARDVNLATGGWIPRGFMTSAGRDASLGRVFGLRELPSSSLAAAYVKRSQLNVDDADATLVFRLAPSRGSDCTIGYAQCGRWRDGDVALSTSTCLIVTDLSCPHDVEQRIVEFITNNHIEVLNVAGHRESTAPMANFTMTVRKVLTNAFRQVIVHK